MKILNVIKYYACRNDIEFTYEMHIRMRFIDRLKFLLFGENCVFRFRDEYELQRRNANLDAFRKWREERKTQESEE